MRFLLILGLLVAGKPFYKCYGWFSGLSGFSSRQNRPPQEDKCHRQCVAVSKYGDIKDVNTIGASMVTAGYAKLSYHGVRASHKMAETDLQNMNRHKDHIMSASKEWVIQPSIIAGIISRESRAGTLLDRSGHGSGGFGLMQISEIHNPRGGPYSYEHISQGTELLVGRIKRVSARHPTWTTEMKLKGGISAYNAGPWNVRRYENLDRSTPSRDYANDVVARAQWYKMHGYE